MLVQKPQFSNEEKLRFFWWLLVLVFATSVVGVDGKRIDGKVTLNAGQATVVTKFCFDYNTECTEVCPQAGQNPGMIHLTLSSGRRLPAPRKSEEEEMEDDDEETKPMVKKGMSEFYVALLDDEYFSFPEVSQIWGEANCSDVLKAAKRSFPLQWDAVESESGADVESAVVEHLRPRWWYIALVSCSKSSVELSYRMHLENTQRGWEAEFSMDQRGIYETSSAFCVVYAVLVAVQSASLQRWRLISKRNHNWYEVHPALLMCSAMTVLALVGQTCTFVYYMYYQKSGEAPEYWTFIGRACLVGAQNCMSTLLMILAHGDCVCSVHIRWQQHREMIFGMVVYACLQLPLELWGDSEFRNTTTEYIYDTRPGIILVAFNLLWTWMYITRCWQTFKSETRIKAKVFYKRYSLVWLLWFSYTPLIALLARSLAAHVRGCIANFLTGLVHLLMLAVLVYTFRPSVADELYDLKESDYEAVNDDSELKSILNDTDEF